MKTCACGRHFTADDWLDLKPLGLMFGPSEYEALEARNCPCASTLFVPVRTFFNADEFFAGAPTKEVA